MTLASAPRSRESDTGARLCRARDPQPLLSARSADRGARLVVLGYQRLDDKIDPGAKIGHEVQPEGPREVLNIVLLGSDTRSGGNAIDGEAGGGGADVSILLHVSADRSRAYGVSLPRDALVDRPDCQVDGRTVPGQELALFNTAYAVGGPLCAVKTVETLTGVFVDHFVALEFSGFVDMVDAVGGVTVCIPKEVDDPAHDIYLDAGTQELDGRQALGYVRERSVLSVTGDVGRMKRQQAFIASMVSEVMSAGTLTRPTRVYDFLAAVTESITVDDDLDSVKALADLATEFRDTGLSRVRFLTVPFEAYEPDPNRSVWTPEADELWRRIRHDEGLGPALTEGSISAATPPGTSSPGGAPSTDGPTRAPGGPTGSPTAPGADDQAARAEALAHGLCA